MLAGAAARAPWPSGRPALADRLTVRHRRRAARARRRPARPGADRAGREPALQRRRAGGAAPAGRAAHAAPRAGDGAGRGGRAARRRARAARPTGCPARSWPGSPPPAGPGRCRGRCSGRCPDVDSGLLAFDRREPAAGRPRRGLRGGRRGVRAAPQDAAVGAGRLGRLARRAAEAALRGGGDRPDRPGPSDSRRDATSPDWPRAPGGATHVGLSACSPPSAPPVTVRVPAKINLHLAVGPLRDDGYHDLVTVFHAVSLFDEVTVAASDAARHRGARRGRRRGAGRRDQPGLAGRASCWPSTPTAIPDVRLVLRKGIPVAGGMAGGSADAAAALVGLSALWKLDLTRDELAELAAELGSDVTFALLRRHRAGHRPRRADRPGAVPAPAALGDRAAPRRAVHPARVRRAGPAARRRPRPPTGRSSRCWRPSPAATRASSRCAWATTCRRRP